MKLTQLFNKPKIIAVISNVNEGKSNTLYHIIEELRKSNKFQLVTYGLKSKITNTKEIYSLTELEQIKNSIIILDEVMSLWDLDNRMSKRFIENSLRLINHNNNILVLAFLPENVKKFISGKIDIVVYKKVSIEDFINGSGVKRGITNYNGVERGHKVLNIPIDEALIFDGNHYHKIKVPYLIQHDTKLNNKPILTPIENVNQSVKQSVNEKKPLKKCKSKCKEVKS